MFEPQLLHLLVPDERCVASSSPLSERVRCVAEGELRFEERHSLPLPISVTPLEEGVDGEEEGAEGGGDVEQQAHLGNGIVLSRMFGKRIFI